MFCGIIFVPLVLRTSCLFNFKCTFQGLTSQRSKLKDTYHKGVQHMHYSCKLHCDMKDIPTLYVILKMSKAWPFRCPTRGKHPHPAKLQASESWKSDHKASNSHCFEDLCDCKNWSRCWIRGGRAAESLCGNPWGRAPCVTREAAELSHGVTLPSCPSAASPHGFQARGSRSGDSL